MFFACEFITCKPVKISSLTFYQRGGLHFFDAVIFLGSPSLIIHVTFIFLHEEMRRFQIQNLLAHREG